MMLGVTFRFCVPKVLAISLLICVLALVSGCTAKRRGTPSFADSMESNLDGATQHLPPGMLLGAPYSSALGESCYEVATTGQTPASPGRALCLRQQGWELLPSIYMDIPASASREIQDQ